MTPDYPNLLKSTDDAMADLREKMFQAGRVVTDLQNRLRTQQERRQILVRDLAVAEAELRKQGQKIDPAVKDAAVEYRREQEKVQAEQRAEAHGKRHQQICDIIHRSKSFAVEQLGAKIRAGLRMDFLLKSFVSLLTQYAPATPQRQTIETFLQSLYNMITEKTQYVVSEESLRLMFKSLYQQCVSVGDVRGNDHLALMQSVIAPMAFTLGVSQPVNSVAAENSSKKEVKPQRVIHVDVSK